VSAALDQDSRVVGWGLVGSFGRGAGDAWSDIDLLVFTRDALFDSYTAENEIWRTADHLLDARRNAVVGGTSVATIHVSSGLAVGCDWYVYPRHMAAWPDDCDIRKTGDSVPSANSDFVEWNVRGEHNVPLSSDERAARVGHLTEMLLVIGKYIARGSPQAKDTLAFVGALAPTDRRSQLSAATALLADVGPDIPPQLRDAIARYLELLFGLRKDSNPQGLEHHPS
jgi:hypothetical protein